MLVDHDVYPNNLKWGKTGGLVGLQAGFGARAWKLGQQGGLGVWTPAAQQTLHLHLC